MVPVRGTCQKSQESADAIQYITVHIIIITIFYFQFYLFIQESLPCGLAYVINHVRNTLKLCDLSTFKNKIIIKYIIIIVLLEQFFEFNNLSFTYFYNFSE